MTFPPDLHSIAFVVLGREDRTEVRVIRGTVTGYAVRVVGDTQEETVTLTTATGDTVTVPASCCVMYHWEIAPTVMALFDGPAKAIKESAEVAS